MPATRLTSRALVRLSPTSDSEDVAAFLQGLVTNDVTGSLPVWAALLSPQGKVLFDFLVWGGNQELLIDCEEKVADQLIKQLCRYRLRRQISIVRANDLAVHWAPLDQDPDLGNDPRLPVLGSRWITVGAANEPSADEAWSRHRLSYGVSEGIAELGFGDLLWLECNATELNGVSFSKGCYVGQENTARMNWRQKVNRRLVVVPLADSDEKRRRAAYPELGLAVDHRRVEDIDKATAPAWLREALA